jgi:hypothetical protein
MGSLSVPAAAGQWTQLFLDTNHTPCLADGSSGTVTLTSYAAAGLDVNQGLGVEVMLGYVLLSGGTTATGTWALTLSETLQAVGTLLTDTLPHNGTGGLVRTSYAKLRFTLQSALTPGTSYLEGYQQDALSRSGCSLQASMSAFGVVGGLVNASPIPAINLTLPFTLRLQAVSDGNGGSTVALENLYTRYYRIGP